MSLPTRIWQAIEARIEPDSVTYSDGRTEQADRLTFADVIKLTVTGTEIAEFTETDEDRRIGTLGGCVFYADVVSVVPHNGELQAYFSVWCER